MNRKEATKARNILTTLKLHTVFAREYSCDGVPDWEVIGTRPATKTEGGKTLEFRTMDAVQTFALDYLGKYWKR